METELPQPPSNKPFYIWAGFWATLCTIQLLWLQTQSDDDLEAADRALNLVGWFFVLFFLSMFILAGWTMWADRKYRIALDASCPHEETTTITTCNLCHQEL